MNRNRNFPFYKPFPLIMLLLCIPFFVSLVTHESKQDHIEGTVTTITNDTITIVLDPSYSKIIQKTGDTISVSKKAIVQKTDFSQFAVGDPVRILYSGIDKKEKCFRSVFALYQISDEP